jgi:hypothetical protein
LISLALRTVFVRLWLNVLEHCGNGGPSVAKFVKEMAPAARLDILPNEVHDELGRDGQFAPDSFLLALFALWGRRRRGSGGRSKIQLSTRQEVNSVLVEDYNRRFSQNPFSSAVNY